MPSQTRGGEFRCGKCRGSPWILCRKFRRHSQNCCGVWGLAGLAAGANSAEDPGFCVGNFAADLHRKISHTKLTGPQSPPPPPTLYWIALPQGHFKREWEGRMLQMGV